MYIHALCIYMCVYVHVCKYGLHVHMCMCVFVYIQRCAYIHATVVLLMFCMHDVVSHKVLEHTQLVQ